MTLLELDPHTYKYNGISSGFHFWCPCCRKTRLSCKDKIISVCDQMFLFLGIFGPGHANIVPCKADMCWTITGTNWSNISVTPSLDASKSGHWHGHISSGYIR